MTFTGDDIKAHRKSQKLSVAKFAERVGLTPTKLYNIEKGRSMTPDEFAAIQPHMPPGAAGTESAAPSEPSVTSPATAASSSAPGPLFEDESDDECDEDDWSPLVSQAPSPVETEDRTAKAAIAKFGGRLFANSELRTVKRCSRKWWFAYYLKLGLKYETPVGPRQLGTVIHACLAGWYVPDGHVRVHPLITLSIVLAQDELKLDPYNPEQRDEWDKQSELARIMLEGYMEWLAETGADQVYEVVAPETTLIVELPDLGHGQKLGLIGKLDARVIRTIDRARMFIDHKTVGSLTDPVKTLHMDEQLMHYDLLEYLDIAAAGVDPLVAERCDGGMYNMLKKVKRTERAKPPFYDRVEVRHTSTTLQSYWLRVVEEIRIILELTRRLDAGEDVRSVAPPNPTGDCTWDCDFFHACSMVDDGSRIMDFLSENYVTISPLKRYEEEPAGA